ncbi:MAG TPA: TonB-dependent receptor, partial [Bryobacteraceae bacterium]|nr:TonB-dependent receptor [Bryobacteraceae bacterium]
SFVRLDYDYSGNGRWPGDPITTPILPPQLGGHIRFNDLALFAQDTWKISPRLTLTPGLRWEYFGAGRRSGHERLRSFNFYRGEGMTPTERLANGRFSPVGQAPGPYAGHAYLPDRNNFAPRLGIAYALTADGKTMLRAGAGVFYEAGYQRGLHRVTQTNSVQIPEVAFTPELLANPYSARGLASEAPNAIYVNDQDLRTPYSSTWNATVEREFRSAVVLGASYVGSSGAGLHGFVTHNQQGSGKYAGRPGERLIPNLQYLNFLQNYGHSSYHSFQLKAESRQIRALGLHFGANYTWGRAIDNGSASDVEGGGFTHGHSLSFTSPRLDRGDSSFDQRQRLVTNFIWQVPAGPWKRGFAGRLIAGWQVSGILSFQSGQPFHVVDLSVPGRETTPFSTRPRVTGALPQVLAESEMIPDPIAPNRFLYLPANRIRRDSACIPNAAPFGCLNSIDDRMDDIVPRSIYRRPGRHSQDVALTKNIQVRESVRVQIRAEFYNLFNHTNRDTITGSFNLANSSFGGGDAVGVVVIYGHTIPGLSPPRQIVVAAKIVF